MAGDGGVAVTIIVVLMVVFLLYCAYLSINVVKEKEVMVRIVFNCVYGSNLGRSSKDLGDFIRFFHQDFILLFRFSMLHAPTVIDMLYLMPRDPLRWLRRVTSEPLAPRYSDKVPEYSNSRC